MKWLIYIKNDDQEAFKELFKVYREKVFCYFLKKAKCRDDAEDLLQNTFLNIWKYRKSLSENHPPDQQIFYIAKNVFIDYTRRQNMICKIQKTVSQRPRLVLPAQEDALELKHLEALLFELPEVRRKAFILHKLQGYSYREVAEHLSISVKSIDNHISRTMKHLRRKMGALFFLFF